MDRFSIVVQLIPTTTVDVIHIVVVWVVIQESVLLQ
jgi:hypothetical protein